MQILVLVEPTPVGQQPFVICVLLGNTTNKLVKRLVKVAMRGNTKTKREKHRVIYVALESIMINKDKQVAHHALLGNTTIKPVKRLVKVAM